MVWVITLLTFLGTATAIVLLLSFLSRSYPGPDPRKSLARHRLEPRTWAAVTLELSTLKDPPIRETTVTENVSHFGACAVTKNRWTPNHLALVRFSPDEVPLRARIAYCNPLGRQFLVGLQFAVAIDGWIPPSVALGFPRR